VHRASGLAATPHEPQRFAAAATPYGTHGTHGGGATTASTPWAESGAGGELADVRSELRGAADRAARVIAALREREHSLADAAAKAALARGHVPMRMHAAAI
jgi:hypothetical protein